MFWFFTDGKQHKARELDVITLEIIHRSHTDDMITRTLECL